jgi:hypothetical protein
MSDSIFILLIAIILFLIFFIGTLFFSISSLNILLIGILLTFQAIGLKDWTELA